MSESQLQHETQAVNKAWFTQLNVKERSTLVATFAGWMLDGMDAMVYSLVLPTLISLWHISKGEAGVAGNFGSPVVVAWRMARRTCCGSIRKGEGPADHDSLVCVLYVS